MDLLDLLAPSKDVTEAVDSLDAKLAGKKAAAATTPPPPPPPPAPPAEVVATEDAPGALHALGEASLLSAGAYCDAHRVVAVARGGGAVEVVALDGRGRVARPPAVSSRRPTPLPLPPARSFFLVACVHACAHKAVFFLIRLFINA